MDCAEVVLSTIVPLSAEKHVGWKTSPTPFAAQEGSISPFAKHRGEIRHGKILHDSLEIGG